MSSRYGNRWLIDGVQAGLILNSYPNNGQYQVVFEREFASIEQIESINWERPNIEYIGDAKHQDSETRLPAGYGFNIVKIEYHSGVKAYHVHLEMAEQYLGDVTEYQKQIALLQATVADQVSTIQTQETTIEKQTATISEQKCTIQDQATTIDGQAAAIQELQEAGTASMLEAKLDAAYVEGVNSVE